MTAGGKDKKKLMFLGGLGVLLAIVMYVNLFSGPSTPTPDRPVAARKSASDGRITMVGAVPKKAARPKTVVHGRTDEFHPVYLANRPEERPDPTTIDPTLRLDLFDKVQDVEATGGTRNLFAFGMPPPHKPVEALKGKETMVALDKGKDKKGAGPGGACGPGGPPGEPPLQINLTYYGIVAVSRGGAKTACFRDGDDILLAGEGDTLKRRYKVMRIGNNSVVMQDTESKREATLPLAEEAKS
jgi:hypothetical protein